MARENQFAADNGYQLPFEKQVMRLQRRIAEQESAQIADGQDYTAEIRQLRAQYVSQLRKTYAQLTPWETVQVARHPQRPLGGDYVRQIVKNFVELHGDRRFSDDRAIVCGLGRIGTEKVVVIASHKGRDTKEKVRCNFGMPHPEGYRKALRVMKLAAKYKLPVVTLVDTAGAYPGIGSEERGVAQAIATNLMEMSRLQTPIVCVVIGEGGSGGAIGIAMGDRIAMLEYAYYSVITPEGCAAILWHTGEKAPEAAEALKLTARHLKGLDVIDDIIPEPLGGAHRSPAEAAGNVERHIVHTIRQLRRIPVDHLIEHRYRRWRGMGKVMKLDLQPQASGSLPQSP